jgi:hypothetical protein
LALKQLIILKLRLQIPLCVYKSIAVIVLLTTASQTLCAAQPPADTIEHYNKLVSRYRYDKPDSATYFANIGLNLAKQLKNVPGQALMLNQLDDR